MATASGSVAAFVPEFTEVAIGSGVDAGARRPYTPVAVEERPRTTLTSRAIPTLGFPDE